MLDEFLASDEGPVTIVFGTFGWRNTLLGWMKHARAAGCGHYRIVCLDDALRRFLCERGGAGRVVDYRDILPDAPIPDLDAMERQERLRSLTPLRMKLFLHLAAHGCDFIHSDADAFWLGDPRPWLMDRPGYDLLCSQGTTFPRPHYHRHHFVLCAGFFFCQANERTRRYFEQADALARHYPDDQVCMNGVLLGDREGHWSLERPIASVRIRGRWSRPPCETAFTRCAKYVLRRPILRALVNGALRLSGIDWILTSREIIRGRFADGLTVGVIPMHVVARGRCREWDRPLVFHGSPNKLD